MPIKQDEICNLSNTQERLAVCLSNNGESGGQTWTNLSGANLDMQRCLLHGPKAEAHGRAEPLSQAWFNSYRVLYCIS